MKELDFNKLRRENRDKVLKYKKELQLKLEELCSENGGHQFSEWENIESRTIGGQWTYLERVCWCCKKTETKNSVFECFD